MVAAQFAESIKSARLARNWLDQCGFWAVLVTLRAMGFVSEVFSADSPANVFKPGNCFKMIRIHA
jgi:hypothetical protein